MLGACRHMVLAAALCTHLCTLPPRPRPLRPRCACYACHAAPHAIALLPARRPRRPCSFVFEGKPPEMKRAELAKRSSKKEEATTELEAAKEVGGRGSAGGVEVRAWGGGRWRGD